jgi:hypothetical protein
MPAYLKQRVLSFEILDQYRDKYFKINEKIINLFLKFGNKKNSLMLPYNFIPEVSQSLDIGQCSYRS